MKGIEMRLSSKIRILFLTLLLLLPLGSWEQAKGQTGFELFLYLPFQVNDIAISGDGRFFAVINATHLSYYSVEDRSLLWWNVSQAPGLGIKLSYNGESVVVGYGEISGVMDGGVSYFDGARSRRGGDQAPKWTHLYQFKTSGSVDGHSMDISDDGNYVAVAGTGDAVYYYADCKSKIGVKSGDVDLHWNWKKKMVNGDLGCLDMTPNGRYFVAGGYNWSGTADFRYVGFFDGQATYGFWNLWNFSDVSGQVYDIAISDDGFGVFVGTRTFSPDTYGVLYFGDSINLRGRVTSAQWWYTETGAELTHVCINSLGSKVASGSRWLLTLQFWSNSRSITNSQTPVWSKDYVVNDVAMSDDGNSIAALTWEEGNNFLRVFNAEGEEISFCPLDNAGLVIAMSRDGKVIAATTQSINSVYLYKFPDQKPVKPVGGDVFQIDKLAMLTPYLLVVLAIVTASSILIKKRKH